MRPTLRPMLLPIAAILLFAVVAAVSANGIIDALLQHASLDALAPTAPPARDGASAPPLELPPVQKVTGLRPSRTQAQPPKAPVPSTLRITLLGTLVATKPEWSLATIHDPADRHAHTLMNGDRVGDAEVVEIRRGAVVFRRGDALEVLTVGAQPSQALTDVRPQAATPSGIRASGDGQWSIERSTLDDALANLNELSRDVRIVPAFDSAGGGFRFLSVRPGSLLARIGVQSGDVVRRINGYTLDDAGKLLEVLQKLREAPRLDVELDRGGARVQQTYRID